MSTKFTIMRLILTISIAVLITACATSNLPPAGPDEVAMDRADRIIVMTNTGADNSYKQIGQYLTDQGFQIKSSDPELMTIQTEFKRFHRGIWAYDMQVSASIRDSSIHLYGQVGNELLNSMDIENRGGNNSQMKNAWLELVKLAEGFGSGKILFSRN